MYSFNILKTSYPSHKHHGNAPLSSFAVPRSSTFPLQKQAKPKKMTLNSTTNNKQTTTASKAPGLPPKSLEEIDSNQLLGFDEELALDHPGFFDDDYKLRRRSIADLARSYVMGTPIPYLQYTNAEKQTWSHVLSRLDTLLPQAACRRYLDALPLMDFRRDSIPQLYEINAKLFSSTGWRIRPVAGLLHPRQFLAGLAFKVFHSTQYMRHHSKPEYTPEPDLCHELIGHMPLLADPVFSKLMEKLGVASLACRTEKAVWHLTKVYWHSAEFGVVWEEEESLDKGENQNGKIRVEGGRKGRKSEDTEANREKESHLDCEVRSNTKRHKLNSTKRECIKALGAGIISSTGELKHMIDGGALVENLNPFQPQPKMSYKDGFQKRYFSLNSLEEGVEMLGEFAKELKMVDGDIERIFERRKERGEERRE